MTEFDARPETVGDISGDYTIDPAQSRLGFTTRHAIVTKVRGQFGEFTGAATINTSDPGASSVRLAVKTNTITTGSADRDRYLRSTDFFGADEDPEITFVSTQVARAGADWTITGNLCLKGATRSVTIPFTETGATREPSGILRLGFAGSTTINRSDWGLNFKAVLETGGVLVSEKVTLEFDISVITEG